MLSKANAILSLFSVDRPELSAVEIAELLGRPRSTVYRIVGSMTRAGFLDQDPVSGRYRVGLRLAMLGELARHSTSLQRVVYPALLRVSERTGEMTTLMVPSGDQGVTVDVVESYHPIRIPGHLGGRFPLHATAGGKVLLAWMPAAEAERILGRPLERRTGATIVNPVRLRKELEETRRKGYAVARAEWLDDVYAVAAPVRDHSGRVVAALAAASTGLRWKPAHIRAMTEAVVAGGREASRALGYSPAAGEDRRVPRRVGGRV